MSNRDDRTFIRAMLMSMIIAVVAVVVVATWAVCMSAIVRVGFARMSVVLMGSDGAFIPVRMGVVVLRILGSSSQIVRMRMVVAVLVRVVMVRRRRRMGVGRVLMRMRMGMVMIVLGGKR